MGKKRKHDEKKPFSIQRHFMHKAKPWKTLIGRSEGSLNAIIRRLKCTNASLLFTKKTNSQSVRLNNTKYPFLTRNLEQTFNSWSSFEQKCQKYASYKENSKPSERSESATDSNTGPQPIIEFPPDHEDENQDDKECNELANNENKNDSFKNPLPSKNGLTRWKNTMELMPSPIAPITPITPIAPMTSRNRQFINDCSFESVQSLPLSSPNSKIKVNLQEDPLSTTMPNNDKLDDIFLQSTPAFMSKLKSKSRKRQFHSTPKI